MLPVTALERRPSQPASHAVTLACPMIPSLPAWRRGVFEIVTSDRSHYLRSVAYMTTLERTTCYRAPPSNLVAPQFCINRTLSVNFIGYIFESASRDQKPMFGSALPLNLELRIFLLYLMLTFTLLSFNLIMGG